MKIYPKASGFMGNKSVQNIRVWEDWLHKKIVNKIHNIERDLLIKMSAERSKEIILLLN